MSTIKPLNLRQNLLWNSVGTFVYLFCQWLTTILVVHLSGFEDAGILSLAMSITTVFYCISLFGIRNYQVSDIECQYTQDTYIKTRYITALSAYLLCVVFVWVNDYTVEQTLAIDLYMFFKLSEALADVYHGALQKRGRMDRIGKSFLIRGALLLIGFTLGLSLFHNLLAGIFLMGTFTLCAVLVYDRLNFRMLFPISDHATRSSVGGLLRCAIPLAINLLLVNIIPTIPRYFIERLYGDELLGIYSSIAAPAMIVQVASSFIFTPLITPFAVAYEKKQPKVFYTLLLQCGAGVLAISVLGLAGAFWLGDWGLQLLFGPAILPYSYLLVPLIVCTVLTAVVWLFSMLLTVLRARVGLIVGSVSGLIICLLTSTSFLNGFYLNGASFSLIFALIVEIVIFMFFFFFKCIAHF